MINFDMINMIKLTYEPQLCEWIYSPTSILTTIAVVPRGEPNIYVYDGREPSSGELRVLKKHSSPVVCLKYSPKFKMAVSICEQGWWCFSE